MVTSDHEGGGRRHAVHAALHHADVLPAVLQLDVSDQHIARRALLGKHSMSTHTSALQAQSALKAVGSSPPGRSLHPMRRLWGRRRKTDPTECVDIGAGETPAGLPRGRMAGAPLGINGSKVNVGRDYSLRVYFLPPGDTCPHTHAQHPLPLLSVPHLCAILPRRGGACQSRGERWPHGRGCRGPATPGLTHQMPLDSERRHCRQAPLTRRN